VTIIRSSADVDQDQQGSMMQTTASETDAPYLFRPLTLRGLTLKNRVVISPMCQHASDDDGAAKPWHLVHLGKFALGGAGLIFTESTAVEPDGRVGSRDLGLWSDEQVAPLKAVVDFVHDNGAVLGVQLSHAGRKAGSAALWEGGEPFRGDQLSYRSRPWTRFGPSAVSAGDDWSVPEVLDQAGIDRITALYVNATRRADQAGADVIELHFGHGYLVASFLSPKSNIREDGYGGSRDNRMRLALEVAGAVRGAWPAHKPLFVRISAVDGSGDGWDLDDSVVLAQRFKAIGVDVVDCSSGGLTETTRLISVPRGLGFQVPFSDRIRHEAEIATQAVGMIVDAPQAEAILAEGRADLVAIGREALRNPYWAHHAAADLGWDPVFAQWPVRHGPWLAKRAPLLNSIRAEQENATGS
jgi:2,4-dienoyl-CoA reductase-like NADH-dependent reductase (Old Yellow Enzyme family)